MSTEKFEMKKALIDKGSSQGWLSLSNISNLALKNIRFEDSEPVAEAVACNDPNLLEQFGLVGCTYMLTDECITLLRRHERLTLKQSFGTGFLNNSGVVVVLPKTREAFTFRDNVFFPRRTSINERDKLLDSLPDDEGVLTLVLPYFDSRRKDREAVLDRVFDLMFLGETSVQDKSFILILINLGAAASEDNQPYNQ